MTIIDDDANRDANFKRAELLEEQGNLSDALKVFLSIDDNRDQLILTRIGRLLYKLEQWSDAESKLLAATRVDPDFWLARFYLGLVYRAQGELEKAEAELFSASKFDDSASTLNVLGVVQLELGLTKVAQESFRKAIKLDADSEESMYNLATTLGTDASSEAIELFERAIELDPHYGVAHREFGWYLRQLQRFPEAEYHLRRSIELDSADAWSRIYLGNLLWLVGDFEGAESSFKEAIKIWPAEAVGYWCLAYFYERQGRNQEAEQLYQRAIEVDPHDAQANWRMGNYLKGIGDLTRARNYLKESIELDPTDKRVLEALAQFDEGSTLGSS